MIKANILVKTSMFSDKREVAEISFKEFHSHESQHCEYGYWISESELEAVARAAWEAGADAYRDYSNFGERTDFASYWSEFKKEK